MKAMAALLGILVATSAWAAEGDKEETVNGLGRTHLADTAICLGQATSALSNALLVIGKDRPDLATVLSKAEATNARFPERFRDTPEALKAEVEALYANPPKSLARHGAQRMQQCVQAHAIPLNPPMVGRCYEVVSFLNAMRASLGKTQTPEAFADLWAPQIARSPEDLAQLHPAVIEQFGGGPMPAREEFILYLRCAMPKAKTAP
ncbi:hypothetical protein [Lysobacter sp. cf310]|uniref:hypothetical protein n=1 Tax=Lysobacter sp. cf310 TaxID=1761790 RepID=UPI0008F13612|nr:hypothetical protein [Lysobacter sp. cf310]SFL15057.1 hypothetical protein SAMN04487938_3481 [Lysobacter sp. cf310]